MAYSSSTKLTDKSVPPTVRVMAAIDRGKPTAFRNILAELVATETNDQWARHILEALITRTSDRQCQRFMGADLVKTGLQLDPESGAHLLAMASRLNAWALMPTLHEMGARMEHMNKNQQMSLQQAMAGALGRGDWSYPDLLCPSLCKSEEMLQKITERFFTAPTLSRSPKHEDALAWFHIEQMSKLPMHANACALFSRALAKTAQNISDVWYLQKNDKTKRALGSLIKLGWLDSTSVIRQATLIAQGIGNQPREPAGFETLKQMLVEAEADWLDRTTQPASASPKPGMRL